MGVIAWIVIGGLAGWLASALVEGTGLGILGDIIVGIIGAIIGGLIMSAFGQSGFTGFNIWSFIVAVVGAVVLLAIVRLVSGGRRFGRRTTGL